jgi:hypothetical protein
MEQDVERTKQSVFILPSLLVSTAKWSVPVMATDEDVADELSKVKAAADPLAVCKQHPETLQWVSRELFRPRRKLWMACQLEP